MKALIITGYEVALSMQGLGRPDYLMKPIRPGELLRAVALYLNRGP